MVATVSTAVFSTRQPPRTLSATAGNIKNPVVLANLLERQGVGIIGVDPFSDENFYHDPCYNTYRTNVLRMLRALSPDTWHQVIFLSPEYNPNPQPIAELSQKNGKPVFHLLACSDANSHCLVNIGTNTDVFLQSPGYSPVGIYNAIKKGSIFVFGTHASTTGKGVVKALMGIASEAGSKVQILSNDMVLIDWDPVHENSVPANGSVLRPNRNVKKIPPLYELPLFSKN